MIRKPPSINYNPKTLAFLPYEKTMHKIFNYTYTQTDGCKNNNIVASAAVLRQNTSSRRLSSVNSIVSAEANTNLLALKYFKV